MEEYLTVAEAETIPLPRFNILKRRRIVRTHIADMRLSWQDEAPVTPFRFLVNPAGRGELIYAAVNREKKDIQELGRLGITGE